MHGHLLATLVSSGDLESIKDGVVALDVSLRAKTENDPLVEAARNDLAAGRLLLALAGDLSQAAIALEDLPDRPSEAALWPRICFNRALAFEQMGLMEPAREEWRRCIPRLEDGWRNEGIHRLQAIAEPLDRCRRPRETTESRAACLDRETALYEGLQLLLAAPSDHPDRTTGDDAGMSVALTDVAASFEKASDDQTWTEVVEEARQLAESETAAEGGRQLAKGLDAYQRGAYDEASGALDRAREHLAGRPGLHSIAHLYVVGATLFDRPAESERELQQLVAEALSARRGWVATYGSRLLALLSSRTRSPLLTLTVTEEAMAIAFRFGYEAQSIDLGLMLAETYTSLRRPERSWASAAKALREAYELGHEDELFFALNLAAGIAEEQQLNRLAERLESEALRIGTSQPVRTRANAHLWRAVLRDRLHDVSGAQEDLRRAVQLHSDGTDPGQKEELGAEIELTAAALELRSNPSVSVDRLSRAMPSLRRQSLDNELRALQMRSEANRSLGQPDAAAEDLYLAIELAKKRLEAVAEGHTTASLEDEVAFQARLAQWARTLVGLELSAGRPWSAFAVSESWKELASRVNGGDLPSVRARAPDLPVTLSRRLRPGEAVVAFGQDEVDVFAWVIRPPPNPPGWVRLGHRADLEFLLEENSRLEGGPLRANLSALYDRLVGPLKLGDSTQLTIIPAPDLEGIPFPSLISPRGRFLVEEQLLRFAMSAASLAIRPTADDSTAGSNPLAGRGLVVKVADSALAAEFGLPPLPAAEEEIAALRRSVRETGGTFVELSGQGATPGLVLEELPDYQWAHLIGHTSPGPLPIIPPALLLQRDEAGRAWVTAADVARLDLSQLRFVVLSTCSSAVRGQDGWMSRALLARGFLAAGARGVVGSLSPVDDRKSAELFRLMYRYLASGTPAAEALQRAQIKMLRSSGGEPGTWLSFIYLGRDAQDHSGDPRSPADLEEEPK